MNNDKPASERSHSPTEQPGDSKWKIEYSKYSTYCNIIDADGYVGTIQVREKAELVARAPALLSEVSTLRSKQAELVAELKACRAEVLRVAKEGEKWMMEAERLKSELLYRDVTVIPEKDAEFERLEHAKIESEKFITSEFFRVRDINFKLTRERDVLQSENANQSAELEQLRSERDKMREALEPLLKISEKMANELFTIAGGHWSKHYVPRHAEKEIEAAQSALSGGSKQ